MNQTGGLLHLAVGLRLSRNAIRTSGRLDLVPPDWPAVGSLVRIPQVVMLSVSTYQTPAIYPPVFAAVRSMIETARPNRTYVLIPAFAGDIVASLAEFVPDFLSIHFGFPASPDIAAGSLVPEMLHTQQNAGGYSMLSFSDGAPPDHGFTGDQVAVYSEREAVFQDVGIDYRYVGQRVTPSVDEIVGVIADHFGFT